MNARTLSLVGIGALAAALAATGPASAFRGGGFGGFRGGNFSGSADRFGDMHYGDIHGPNGTTYYAGRPGMGGDVAHVNNDGVWHAGGANANGGTWHAEGYHGNAYYAGGWHSPTVVNNYVGGGCWGCSGWNTASAAVAGAAVGLAAGAAIGAATAPAYPIGQLVVALPPGCSYNAFAGVTYQVCGGQWFRPYYGSNGLYYRVVAAPY